MFGSSEGLSTNTKILANLVLDETHMPRTRTSERKDITDRVALTDRRSFLQQPLLAFLFLLFDTKLSFQPTLSRLVIVSLFVLLELRKKRSNARDGRSFSVFRRVVRWREESKTRARREQREKIRGELVRHINDGVR